MWKFQWNFHAKKISWNKFSTSSYCSVFKMRLKVLKKSHGIILYHQQYTTTRAHDIWSTQECYFCRFYTAYTFFEKYLLHRFIFWSWSSWLFSPFCCPNLKIVLALTLYSLIGCFLCVQVGERTLSYLSDMLYAIPRHPSGLRVAKTQWHVTVQPVTPRQ